MPSRALAPGFAVLLAAVGFAADPPADPLPEGATARLGTTRMRFPSLSMGSPLAPDFKDLAATDRNGKTVLIDLTTGTPAGKAVKLPDGGGNGFVLTADGSRAVRIGYGDIVVADARTGEPVGKLTVKDLPYSRDGSVSVSRDGKWLAHGGRGEGNKKGGKMPTAVVWDVDAGKAVNTLNVIQNSAAYVALSGNGKRLVTWGNHDVESGNKDPEKELQKVLQLWDLPAGKEVGKVRIDGYFPGAVQLSNDGTVLAVAAGSGAVDLYNAATGKPVRSLLGRRSGWERLAFSPDDKQIAAIGSGDAAVERWAVADGRILGVTENPLGVSGMGSLGVGWTGPDKAVAWGVDGIAFHAWDVPGGTPLLPPSGHRRAVTGIGFGAGGKEVVTGSGGQLLKWDASTGKPLGPVAMKTGGGYYYGGSEYFPTADAAKVLSNGSVFDLAGGGVELFSVPGDPNLSPTTYPSADGTHLGVLLTTYGDKVKTGKWRVYDAATGRKLGEGELPNPAGAHAASVSPDGKYLVTALNLPAEKKGESKIVVNGWEVASGKKLGELTFPGGYGSLYLTATGGPTAALVTPDGKLSAIDFVAGKATPAIELKDIRVKCKPVPSADGKRLALGVGQEYRSEGGEVRVYDWPSGQLLQSFKGHAAQISALAFSPDGKTLASGSQDTTVLLWKLD